MKFKKYSILPALFLCFSILLTACAKDGESEDHDHAIDEDTENTNVDEMPEEPEKLLDNIYSPGFSYVLPPLSEAVKPNVEGECRLTEKYFSIFKTDESGSPVYTVYSHVSNEVIGTFKSTEAVSSNEQGGISTAYSRHGFNVIATPNNTQILAVATYEAAEINKNNSYTSRVFDGLQFGMPISEGSVRISFYDAYGACFYTYGYDDKIEDLDQVFERDVISPLENDLPSSGNTGLFVILDTVFSISHDGAVTEIKAYDSQAIPNISQFANDNYYAFSYERGSVQIFDRKLERVNTITLPDDLSISSHITCYALNNGDIFLQYRKILEADATEYDLVEIEYASSSDDIMKTKYDLLTYVISAQTGEAKPIEVNYIVDSITPISHIADLLGDSSSQKVLNIAENVAVIYYITESKELIKGYHNVDRVVFNNDGTVSRTLILKNHWISVPTPLENTDLFTVYTINDETEVINRSGHLLFAFSGRRIDDSIFYVGQKSIYNITDGKKVYEGLAKTDKVIPAGNMYFIEKTTKSGVTELYALLSDGTLKTLGVLEGDGATVGKYEYVSSCYYMVQDLTTGKFDYYNTLGQLIISADSELDLIGSTADGVILREASGDYIKFTNDLENYVDIGVITDSFTTK